MQQVCISHFLGKQMTGNCFRLTAVTHAKEKHENHVGHWQVEHVVDVAMLPLIPFAFITDNVYANYALILCLGAHVHW
jgi:CybS, succinate dehydrogenase cytochrome B small subunit